MAFLSFSARKQSPRAVPAAAAYANRWAANNRSFKDEKEYENIS